MTEHNVVPAFVHVDLDNLWAISDCYGFSPPEGQTDFVYEDAVPRLGRLFREAGISATLFVVGRDLNSEANIRLLRDLITDGHMVANHSQTHPLTFRNLSKAGIEKEVSQAEDSIHRHLGVKPQGFRAPGYGISRQLLSVLAERGYDYDCSAMPGPYGSVFRWLDSRLRATAEGGKAAAGKTQYSRLGDMLRYPLAAHRVFPERVGDHEKASASHGLIEIPSATSPLLRLPFQAGVCLRLGRRYFDAHLAACRRRRDMPLLFLLHAADVTDFAALNHPFFQRSSFFSGPVADKEAGIRYFLKEISTHYRICSTEAWIQEGGASGLKSDQKRRPFN